MITENQLAFIDEFGDSGFDFKKPNVSTHFIVSAVLVDDSNIGNIEDEIERIRSRHFQKSEMKSSKVGSNHKRRKIILQKISGLDFQIYAFVFDKRKLTSEGLRYRDSFYKFLNGIVESNLYRTFPKLKITADQIGSKEFMDGFIKYVKKRHIPDLFSYSDYGFVESKSNLCIQLSDFVCGTLARVFDEKLISRSGPSFIDILKEKIIDINEWPKDIRPYLYRYGEEPKIEFDYSIAQQSINSAKLFIEENEKKPDQSIKEQVQAVKYLLLHISYINYSTYVSTNELINNLEMISDRKISEHYFRSEIIAKLRDQGVLIASSPKGYKLPTNEQDLWDFINQISKIIKPMLARLEKCRKHIRLATKNKIDILDRDEYEYLKEFFDR
jgi:biotin operon repressor